MKNMSDYEIVHSQILLARRELKNIRQELLKYNAKFKSEFKAIQLLLCEPCAKKEDSVTAKDENDGIFKMVPIGTICSCFKNKNGIPRQPSLCKSAKATLEIDKTFFTNPEHSLIGLNQFSHVWVLFVFNKNGDSSVKAKVHPPRLNGESIGVFSTRSPHRPCAIGLSLTKLDKIIGNTLFLSGVDILDGTPVLDIKPYIPSYDTPVPNKYIENKLITMLSFNDEKHSKGSIILKRETIESDDNNSIIQINRQDKNNAEETTEVSETNMSEKSSAITKLGCLLTAPSSYLDVVFTPRANEDLEKFHSYNQDSKCKYCLQFITGFSEAKKAIEEILQNDPRSVYRKKKCSDKLYYFEVDCMHITCWFDDKIAEVLRVKPIKES